MKTNQEGFIFIYQKKFKLCNFEYVEFVEKDNKLHCICHRDNFNSSIETTFGKVKDEWTELLFHGFLIAHSKGNEIYLKSSICDVFLSRQNMKMTLDNFNLYMFNKIIPEIKFIIDHLVYKKSSKKSLTQVYEYFYSTCESNSENKKINSVLPKYIKKFKKQKLFVDIDFV